MRRRILSIATVTSLLLFAAVLMLWIVSHQSRPNSWFLREWGDDKRGTAYTFEIYDGQVSLTSRAEPQNVQYPPEWTKSVSVGTPRGPQLDILGMHYSNFLSVADVDGKRPPSIDGSEVDVSLSFLWILVAAGVLPGWWLLARIERGVQRQLALRPGSPNRLLRLSRPINALTLISLLLCSLTLAARLKWSSSGSQLIGSPSGLYRITFEWTERKSQIYIAVRGIGVNSDGIFWANLRESFRPRDKTETMEGLSRYLAQITPPYQSRTFWDTDFEQYASVGGSYSYSGDKHQIDFKLLLAAFATFPIARLLWNLLIWTWLSRRHPVGSCAKCGYDLTANTSGVCPECGTPVPSKPEPVT